MHLTNEASDDRLGVTPTELQGSRGITNHVSLLQADCYTSSCELASPETASPTSYKSLAAPVSEASWEDGDRHWDHLCPLFHPGEVVLVRAGLVLKGRSPYCGLLEVIQVLGQFTFELSDSQRWCTRRIMCRVDQPAETMWELLIAEQEQQVAGQEMPNRTMQDTAGKLPDHIKP